MFEYAQSRLQTIVATSLMEAEYMALYALIQDICWLKGGYLMKLDS